MDNSAGKELDPGRKHILTRRNQVLAFTVLCVASILFWWHPLIDTFGLALSNDAYTHILLILPFSASLIYLDSKSIHSKRALAEAKPNLRLGAILLVIAFLSGCSARWGMFPLPSDGRLSVAMFALVIWWIASVLLVFGSGSLRAFLFPLCFLFLIVPIPGTVLSVIVEFLQHQSAFASRVLFRAAGVPATQDGIMVFIPGLDIEVARECSSIRSSMVLVVITMVLAHLFLRPGWRKALLIVAAIPLSVLKNGLRILTIGELGTRVDPGFLTGRLHHQGGIIFLAISIVWVVILLWILRRSEMRRPLAPSIASTH